MEANVCFIGAGGEDEGAIVEAAVEEEKAESVGVLQAKLADAEDKWEEDFENDEIWGIWVEEQLGEVTHSFLFVAGDDGFV